ncbi:MAG: uroporphyrinogen-III synthase [Gammaproteobacteria bacterium]|nr:uroporphyrinogen-III synthase [Gammaproteobacteria bacterium]
MSEKYLRGLRVLVTRPFPEGEVLSNKIRAAGGDAHHLPTITIVPDKIHFAGQYDWLIFVSPQAVRASINAIRQQWSQLPAALRLAAIGSGSARVLNEYGFHKIIFPHHDPCAASLLALPEFQSVEKQHIALIQGAGGRTELFDTLTARGAQVTPLIAYRRECPTFDDHWVHCAAALMDHSINAIVVTSTEGLQNFIYGLEADLLNNVYSVPLVVVSPRIAKHAHQLGFQKILLAENAGHNAIMSVLSVLSGREVQ